MFFRQDTNKNYINLFFKKKWKFSYNICLKKKPINSGGSRFQYKFKNFIPLQIKIKKLIFSKKWNSGRGNKGRIIFRKRGSKSIKNRFVKLNNNYRYRNVSFISSYIMLPFSNKLVSLVMLSSGSCTYLRTTINQELFTFTRLNGLFFKNSYLFNKVIFSSHLIYLPQTFYLIYQLPKNKFVSSLQLKPEKDIQYTCATGTKSLILKMDNRTGSALVKLPSGVKKVFSIYSVGLLGEIALPQNKLFRNNSAGFYKKFGKKSLSRGIAKNPIDHPHGGNSNAIRYQRTPWGKTTKFK